MASSHQPKDFDVFLSFRGEDTRGGFVSHLHDALTRYGIKTFIDYNLPRGENISEELLEAIENSSASIIVFSKNYASSSWCLDELAKIMECSKKVECSQKVLPVFYQVDPSEVRKQTGNYGKELTKHEKKNKDKTKVQRWREALTNAAKISGRDYKDSCTESEFVKKIVEDISEFIPMPSNDATMQQLVGISSRVEAVTELLDIDSNDVRMVAITGLGGIGKTTIAKAIYNSSFSNHFKAKSFVENVGEGWSKTEEGKIRLQQTLLKGISEDKNLSVDNLNEGSTMINRILRRKRVLIILDDVDNADQIETLLGQCEGFAFGSRIILTTRNKSLLVNRNGLSTYEVKELDKDEAIKLFRKHAFRSNKAPDDYLELEKQAISYAKGLPLALKVMGRDLCEKPIRFWNNALDYYKKNLLEDIQKILRRSYDGLTENERNIFLDIACFFKGYDMSYNMIEDVLKACGLDPGYGIEKLIDKCLIDRYDDYLSMHDLLQQMGMDIVRQEAPRSRVWRYEEALDVLTKDMGSDKTRSMILWPPKSEQVEVQVMAQICKMKNLRLLLIRNVRCCNGPPVCLPNGLILLDWRDYPFSSRPPNFFPEKVVVLNSPFILLKEPVLKEPVLKQNFESVKYMDFSGCDLIRKIPDLSMYPNLMTLILFNCGSLIEIDDSVGRLDKLEKWVLTGCHKLETLPDCLTMKSLKSFDLEDCWSIKKFPNILHEMEGVEYLSLPESCNELPPSFGNLIGLKFLSVGNADLVEMHLPGSIYNLQRIEELNFIGNAIFPKNVEIDRQPMSNSPKCVFPRLKKLDFVENKIYSEIEFILNYCCPHTLEELGIYNSNVVTLPESMSRFERLHTVIISCCDEFQEIRRLPHSIRRVEVYGCYSLDLQSFFQLVPEIIGLPPNLPPCLGVTSHMFSQQLLPRSLTFPVTSGEHLCEHSFEVDGDDNDIPNWFNHQRDGNLISFSIGPEFPTIALCIAFGIQGGFDYQVFVSINDSERTFERKLIWIPIDGSFRHLSFSCRPQSSLQELFRDLQLTDRNHVEILCQTSPPYRAERIGVHVECNCPPPQNPSIIQDINRPLSLQSGLGLPMDTEDGSDLGSALDSSNVDGFDLGSSLVAQPPVNDDFDSNQFPLWERMGRLLIGLFLMVPCCNPK